MGRLLQKLSDIKDLKKLHWRYFPQGIILAACFCTADTSLAADNALWLIGAGLVLAVMIAAAFLFERIRVGFWSNALNLAAAALFVMAFFGFKFAEVLLPPVLAMALCIQIIYAGKTLNLYSALVFIITIIVSGMLLRHALILAPEWVCSILVLLTVPNPVIQKRERVAESQDKDIETKPVNDTKKLSPLTLKMSVTIVMAIMAVFFITVELFGGLATHFASGKLPSGGINIYYVLGIVFFTILLLIVRLKYACYTILITGFAIIFLHMLPFTTDIMGYVVLFIGGGVEALILAFPMQVMTKSKRYYTYIAGLFILRAALFLKGGAAYAFKDSWTIDNGALQYALLAVIVITGLLLAVCVLIWDKKAVREIVIEKIVEVEKEVVKEVAIVKISLPADLSKQERRVAELILKGKTRPEMCAEMGVSEGTVKVYIARLYTKTGVDNQRQFFARYLGEEE
jgi:DNA-binding CsgD family transcriptional regulator/MFS family permease